MFRSCVRVVLGSAIVFVSASGASAQSGGVGGPVATPILMAMDLAKVPLGSWAEYRASDGGGNAVSIKLALVGRAGRIAELETIVEGGPLAALGRTSVRTSIFMDTGADANPNDHVLQVGANAPMFIPAAMSGAQAQSFRRADPKEKISVDALTVPGGTFGKAEHFRSKKSNGDVVDTWVSRDIPPFGLLKIRTAPAAATPAITMELVAHGADARRTITAKPSAFDPATLMKLLQPLMPLPSGASSAAPAHASTPRSSASSGAPKSIPSGQPRPLQPRE